MKLLTLLPIFLLISFGNFIQAQTSGGPDTFGYIWANDLDPLGPAYNWKDIKNTANLISGLGDDNSVGPFDPGFYFNYYGQWYNTVWIGSNGWISFQPAGNITVPFPVIPSPSAPDNIIACMLADLTFIDANDSAVTGANAYFWTNHTDSVIIQYDSVPFWDTNATGYSGINTFQIILIGTDNSITFQYKQQINSIPLYDLNVTGLKTGIEDSTGNDGLQVSDTFPQATSAVKFFYPGHFSTNDLDNAALLLEQNYPNPASDLTRINYSVRKTGNIKLSIQSLLGKQVDSFYIGKILAGNHSFMLNTRPYPSGIYFYSLSVDGATCTQKMVITK